MKNSVEVELKGHIIDSLTLPKVLDSILESGARCEVLEIKVGVEKTQSSYAKLKIMSESRTTLDAVIESLTKYGISVINN
jgi:hypothetical protein